MEGWVKVVEVEKRWWLVLMRECRLDPITREGSQKCRGEERLLYTAESDVPRPEAARKLFKRRVVVA